MSLGGGVGLPVSSIAPGMKDPRPVRDKSYQAECIKCLLEFLIRSGYSYPISPKILNAPSGKDFQQIFKFLYGHLDSSYEFGKKFEEEVPALMKGLRYPFASEISKSQLQAVGSTHAWPPLLAMLKWMVELIECCEGSNNSMMEADAPVDDALVADRLFFDYLCKAYKRFLAGNDDYDGMIAELSANFDIRNAHVISEAQALEEEVSRLDSTIKSLTSEESPLAKATRERGIYRSDKEKFEKFIAHLHVKKSKFLETLQKLAEDVAEIESNIAQVEIERSALAAQVEAQSINPEDIDRMNADKDMLVKTLDSLNQSKEELARLFWEREMAMQKKLDSVEKLVHEYNFATEKLGLNVMTEEFELVFNPNARQGENFASQDVRSQIQPKLMKMRDDLSKKSHELQDQLIALQDELDRLCEAHVDRQRELAQDEDRLRRAVESYLEQKEKFSKENNENVAESERLEQAISKMKSDLTAHGIASQQRLQRMTLEYDQTVTRVAEEKERIATEIFKILEELINFKSNVESTLSELEAGFSREE